MKVSKGQALVLAVALVPTVYMLRHRVGALVSSIFVVGSTNSDQFRETSTNAASSERLKKLRADLAKAGKPKMNVVVEEKNEMEKLLTPEIEDAHKLANTKGEKMYEDPTTGLWVFTRQAHLDRGKCCGSHCRHCPFGHTNVLPKKRDAWVEKNKTTIESMRTKVTQSSMPKVYTKTGDGGSSSLFTGERREKSDPIFEALGTVDELNSVLGMARAQMKAHAAGDCTKDIIDERQRVWEALGSVQANLLVVGSIVATPPGTEAEAAKDTGNPTIDGARPREWTKELELGIDSMDNFLPPLNQFIIPGGSFAAAQLHVARSTCRRAERRLIEVKASQPFRREGFDEALKFVNRLSDFLFTAARLYDL